MSVFELVCFATVCRTGGVTSAASDLGVAKSVVSKQVSRLERHLGVRLLERASRRVRVTREGERLLPRIESVIADAERLFVQAEYERGRPEGRVRIAATPELGALIAREVFPVVIRAFPALRLVMTAVYSHEDLQDPAYDLGIRIGDVSDDRLVAHRAGSFRRIVVASPEFIRRSPLRTPADLAETACLVFSASRATTRWTLVPSRGKARARAVEVHGAIAVRSLRTLVELAMAGEGYAFVPEFVARDGIDRGTLVRGLPTHHSRLSPVHIVHRVGAGRVQRIRVVVEQMRASLPALLDPSS